MDTQQATQTLDSDRSELARLMLYLDRASLSTSLSQFVEDAWPIIEPATPFQRNWHIDLIAEYLMCVESGEITRLIVNIPPRMMKSILITIMYPVWVWTKRPAERFIFTSYSDSLATDHSIARRSIIESDWYQERWHDKFALSSDQNQKKQFNNTESGRMLAIPVGGPATGKGANTIIIDDPQDPEDVESDAERMKAIRFARKTLPSRLDNKKTDKIILVMQRLHQADLTADLTEDGNWTVLKIPAIAPTKTVIDFPRTKRKMTREKDDILWPSREGKKELDVLRLVLRGAFSGQYQQQPEPETGSIIERDWWKFYDEADIPESFDLIVDSWDCNFAEDGVDPVCGTKWGAKGANIYLLRYYHEKVGFTDTQQAVLSFAADAKWIAGVKLIEKKANGAAIIDTLKTVISGLWPVEPAGGKSARLRAASPIVKVGNVFLPKSMPRVQELIEECAMMPLGAHDDWADSFSQAINFIVLRGGGIFTWLANLAREAEAREGKEKEQDQEQRKNANIINYRQLPEDFIGAIGHVNGKS